MSTHDYSIANQSGSSFRSDLNNCLSAIVGLNNNATAPSTTFAYMLWVDSSNNLIKIRNSANDAWLTLLTTAGGIDVDAASNFNEDVTFVGATSGRDCTWDKSNNALEFADNAKIKIGSSSDFSLYHDGSDSFLNDSGTGALRIVSNQTRIQNAAGDENCAKFNENGSVDLYYDGTKELATISGGVSIPNELICGATSSEDDTCLIQSIGNSNTNHILLHNISASDGDHAGYSKLKFSRTRSGGESSSVSEVFCYHPGTGDDDKGVLGFKSNSGSGLVERAVIAATGHLKAKSTGDYKAIDGYYHELINATDNNNVLYIRHSGGSGNQYGVVINHTNDHNSASTYFLRCSGASTDRFEVQTTGNAYNSNNTWGSLSDVKLKENIVDAKSQWNDIKGLKIRNFNFKTDSSKTMLGVVAQEAELISPGLIEESPDTDTTDSGEIINLGTTTKYVKYSVLYMKAIKCLQEAMAKIEVLETEVAALKAG